MTSSVRTPILTMAVLACMAVFPQLARADGNGTITIVTSSVNKGSVTDSGSYTTVAGWQATSITLFAVPVSGGVVNQQGCPAFGGGSWGATTISGLTPGVKYTVYAQMVIVNTTTHYSQTINSPSITQTPQ